MYVFFYNFVLNNLNICIKNMICIYIFSSNYWNYLIFIYFFIMNQIKLKQIIIALL